MSAAIGNRSSPPSTNQYSANQLHYANHFYCLHAKHGSLPACCRREGGYHELRSYYYVRVPAQRLAEALGTPTHAQLHLLLIQLTLCSFTGIGAGSASSLPSLVLRSMLKQRRILMRMH